MLVLLTFSQDRIDSFSSWDVETILKNINGSQNIWLRCIHFRDRTGIAKIIQHFGLNPSRVDTIFNYSPTGIDQDIEDCLFKTYEILTHEMKNGEFEVARGSIVSGKNFIITFEINEVKIFNQLIPKIQKHNTSMQNIEIDYFFYILFKEILSSYRTVFEYISRHLDDLEDEVLENSGKEITYQKIAAMRQSTRFVRRTFQSIKLLISMIDDEFPWFSPFVKDLFKEELIHQVENLWQEYQALRAWMSELMEIQRDNIASKTSERINRLTILSSIFLPITFIAGLYGMNFKYMPELEQPWAYPATICVMILIAIGSIVYAKQQRWL
jgi:magnesium transporter